MMWTWSRDHKNFHFWIRARGLYTLAWSPATLNALAYLETQTRYPDTLTRLAIELMPVGENKFLARKHGSRSTYSDGCRGPLCRWANNTAQRELYGKNEPGTIRRIYEINMEQVRLSYEAYLDYLRHIMEFRRNITSGEKQNRHWSKLTLRDTLLIDQTDETWLDPDFEPKPPSVTIAR